MKIINVLQAAFAWFFCRKVLGGGRAPPTLFDQKNSSVLDDSQNWSVEFKKGGSEPKMGKFSALAHIV